MIVSLSGKEMISQTAMHRQLKERLAFADHYGENLDALWDSLHYVALPLTVKWLDFAVSQQQLGSYADRTLQTFQEAQQVLPGFAIEVLL